MPTLQEQMDQLRQDVNTLTQNNRRRLKELREEARATQASVKDLMADFRSEWTASVQEAAEARRARIEELREEVERSGVDVAEMLRTFRDELAEAARASREQRPAAAEEARAFVERIREEVRDLRRTLAERRAQQAEQGRAERQAFVEQMRSAVAELLAAARADLEGIEIDVETAVRRASAGEDDADTPGAEGDRLSSLLDEARSQAGATDESEEETEEDEVRAADTADDDMTDGDTADDPNTDNLAAIQGIGPKMSVRMREAGVRTFEELAEKEPDEIRELMGDLPSFADVESWIEQAREHTESDDQS